MSRRNQQLALEFARQLREFQAAGRRLQVLPFEHLSYEIVT
jgi:hypothetical protein